MPPANRSKRRAEDSDERDAPRKKKKKPAPSMGMLPILLGGGAVGVAVLVLVLCVTIWLVVRNRGDNSKVAADPNPNAKAEPAPAGATPADTERREAVVFYRRYSKASQRLEDGNTKLWRAINSGQGFDTQETKNALNAARAESATWTVPNSDAGRKLNECFQQYLQLQDGQLQHLDMVWSYRLKNVQKPVSPPNTAENIRKARELEGAGRAFIEQYGLTEADQ